jgi:hypothetical protein
MMDFLKKVGATYFKCLLEVKPTSLIYYPLCNFFKYVKVIMKCFQVHNLQLVCKLD